jgi:hypothetical protein
MAIGTFGNTLTFGSGALARRTPTGAASSPTIELQDLRNSLKPKSDPRPSREATARSLGAAYSTLDDVLAQLAAGLRMRTMTDGLGAATAGTAPAVRGYLSGGVNQGATPARIDTTQEVNATASTERRSAVALGLDTTTAERASVLRSSAALGLDLTSPDAASTLVSDQPLGLDTTSPSAASRLVSAQALALDLTSPQAVSVRQSSAEINTAPTSYSTPELSFSLGTSKATLSGVYTGTGVAAGATSLAVRITNTLTTTTVGSTATNVRFAVVNQSGTTLKSYSANLTAGQEFDLGAEFGLKIAFSAGTLRRNNVSSATTVSKTVGTDVNPAAAFNGTANTRPRFENGAVVGAGRFTVNGAAIDVLAGDSIQSVLAKIDASSAGVTASFANDRVTLATKGFSEGDIVLGTDTSGFLAAVKLASAGTQRGNVRDDLVALSRTAAFAGVRSGAFTVDGRTISVDAANDSLQGVIDRINGSGARVTASFDPATLRVTLQDQFDSEDLVSVGNDTSGFLAAAGLDAAATQRGNLPDDQQVLAKTTQFAGVASGLLTVNGASINVDRGVDTLQSVLARINASGAGVAAAYDASSDRVSLTTNGRSEDAISIDDATGFAAAAGLASANTVRGNVRDDQQVLAKTTQFSGVTSGSFTVDGVRIDVDAGADSVQAIVDRINASGARVTAALDAATDRLVLTDTFNSEAPVQVGADTTGFLAAARLDPANTERGRLRDDTQALAGTSRFASVGAGSFLVNGVAVQVDGATDSLSDVLARVSGAGAGVTANYDATADRVLFTPATAGAPLALTGDTSGFLAAAGLEEGTAALAANADGALDDAGLTGARLEVGRLVTAGSFRVNGTRIDVAANDTVRGVLRRITDSAAGVNALYDDATERISLVAKTAGAGGIVLSDDTSGFLAATKLDATASVVAGADGPPPLDTPLALLPSTSGVTAGTLSVNGTSIAVAPQTTTLRDLLASMNAVEGVSASISPLSGEVRIDGTSAGASLTLADDTGLLKVLGVSPGTVQGTPDSPATATVSRLMEGEPAEVAATTLRTAQALNDSLELLRRSAYAPEARALLATLEGGLAGGGASGLGLSLDTVRQRLSVDEAALASAVTSDGEGLGRLLARDGALTTAVQAAADLLGRAASDASSAARPAPVVRLDAAARAVAEENRLSDMLALLDAVPRTARPEKEKEKFKDKANDAARPDKKRPAESPSDRAQVIAASATRAYGDWGAASPRAATAAEPSVRLYA